MLSFRSDPDFRSTLIDVILSCFVAFDRVIPKTVSRSSTPMPKSPKRKTPRVSRNAGRCLIFGGSRFLPRWRLRFHLIPRINSLTNEDLSFILQKQERVSSRCASHSQRTMFDARVPTLLFGVIYYDRLYPCGVGGRTPCRVVLECELNTATGLNGANVM